MATGEQLQKIYTMIRVGEKRDAANALAVLLAADPDNVDALWLQALAAPDVMTVQRTLTRLLELRPDDQRARHMLDSIGLRQFMNQGRSTSQEMRAVIQRANPITDWPPMVVRPRESQRPRRPLRTRTVWHGPGAFPIALTFAVVFGLVGCALLTVAALAGLKLVQDTVYAFSLTLPFIVPDSPSAPAIPGLGDVNALGSIEYWQFRTGVLMTPADRHTYTFTATTGDFILIELTAPNSTLDPALALYGPEGGLIAGIADNSAEDHNARLSLSIPAPGEYTLLVGAQNSQGGYQLMLQH